jgi:hypothetical protein
MACYELEGDHGQPSPSGDIDSHHPLVGPEPHRINLHTPIRVFIVYTTALAAEDGRTLFFRDIYGQDTRLQALLDARSRQSALAGGASQHKLERAPSP